jgi:hypothetical protein
MARRVARDERGRFISRSKRETQRIQRRRIRERELERRRRIAQGIGSDAAALVASLLRWIPRSSMFMGRDPHHVGPSHS